MGRGPNPINRTQSAAQVRRTCFQILIIFLFSNPNHHHEQVAPAPRSLSSAAPESRIRSASVAPQQAR